MCAELPTRRSVLPSQLAALTEACGDFVDEHEASLHRLLTERSASFARRLCTTSVPVCASELSDDELFAHDPAAARKPDKDEV